MRNTNSVILKLSFTDGELKTYNFLQGNLTYLGEKISTDPYHEITVRNLSDNSIYFTLENDGSINVDETDTQGVFTLFYRESLTISHVNAIRHLRMRMKGGSGDVELHLFRYKRTVNY